ncbi:two-component system response regulator (stage 0 sporulation protein F) [Hypnocyclicus thermotrophus]|uniref:Two-component system response regulator (Stage 0 sporulation protein F) n=1 Tax=Hypnocyclicus thermotrophus TaxID=1627895 RepID=A0AA46I5K2_9FUSO|nr:response regulator [Hypnocyclicus thermotrophus]TDT68586.1 two-component system response regulator (stage 0 sporulation protein F) [Hypnocyclicus thermotrophus]
MKGVNDIKTVLIIDDEPTIRFLLKEIISDMGYKVLEASRAEKGLQLIKKEKIDLILLDIQLPNMNGLEAIQQIRKINMEVPVFMITAFHNMKNVVEMLDVEIQGFIPKPFEILELKDKISKILEAKK